MAAGRCTGSGALLIGATCSILSACGGPAAAPQTTSPPPATAAPMPPAPALPTVASTAPAKAPPAAPSAACSAPIEPAPNCGEGCKASVLWTKSYGNRVGAAPSLLQIVSNAQGDIVLAGMTGAGPAYLGGRRALNDEWPRSAGEAFVAKYDRTGAHLWSKQLFDPTSAERKRGARSSVRAMVLGGSGAIYVLASQIGKDGALNFVATVPTAGDSAKLQLIRGALPVFVTLAEENGALSALGLRRQKGERISELIKYSVEQNGDLIGTRVGTVSDPPGNALTEVIRFHPLGFLWTADLVRGKPSAPDVGGTLICPIIDTKRERQGRLVRQSETPRQQQCPWPTKELAVEALAANGTSLWTRTFSVPNHNSGLESITADALGNTYLVGSFTGAATFDAHVICAAGLPSGYVDDYFGSFEWDAACECTRDYEDVFLAKLDPTGKPLWVQRLGGPMQDRIGPVLVDSLGNIVVAVGATPLPDFTVPHRGPPEPIWAVHAYSPNGEHIWTHQLNAPSPPLLAAGQDGVVVVAESVKEPAGIRLTALQSWPRTK